MPRGRTFPKVEIVGFGKFAKPISASVWDYIAELNDDNPVFIVRIGREHERLRERQGHGADQEAGSGA